MFIKLSKFSLFLIVYIFTFDCTTDNRVEKLIGLSSQNHVIHLKESLDYFAKSVNRDYSLIVFFKTSDLHPFYKSYVSAELSKLASAYNDAQNITTTKHKLFAIITEDMMFLARNQKKLSIKFLPVIVFFPPYIDPTYKDVFDIRFNELVATYFSRWVKSYIPVKINIEPKINRTNAFVTMIVLFGIIFIGYMARAFILKFNTRNFWCCVVLFSVSIFLSGHMYNSINHSPEVNEEEQGISRYIGRGRRGQLGFESKIIALSYILGCIGFSLLNENWKIFSKKFLKKSKVRKFLGLFLLISSVWIYNFMTTMKMGFSLFPLIFA